MKIALSITASRQRVSAARRATERPSDCTMWSFSENSPSKIFFDSGSVFLPYLHMKVQKQPMTNNNKWLLTFKTLVAEIIWVYESFQIQLNSCWEVNFMLFF